MPARKGSGSVRKRGKVWEFSRDERPLGAGQIRRSGYVSKADADLARIRYLHEVDRARQHGDSSIPLWLVGEKWLAVVGACVREWSAGQLRRWSWASD